MTRVSRRIWGSSVLPGSPGEVGERKQAAGGPPARPARRGWLVAIFLVLFLCLCSFAGAAYFLACPSFGPDAPLCFGLRPEITLFNARPAQLARARAPVVIGWDVHRADRVELSSPELDFSQSVELRGIRRFNLQGETTFLLRATNSAGTTEETLVVGMQGSPPVILYFTATPNPVGPGQNGPVTLSWSVSGADTVYIEELSFEDLDPTFSLEIPVPIQPTTYTLLAENEFGSVRKEVLLEIERLP